MYQSLVRPFLFWLSEEDPEMAHNLTIWLGKVLQATPGMLPLVRLLHSANRYPDQVEVMGLTFPNRVGLSAGFDKKCEILLFLQALGFGFVELGTVLPRAQPGNPRPRMFRIKELQSLINRMGLNTPGATQFAHNYNRAKRRIEIPIGISVGKNETTPLERSIADHVDAMRIIGPHLCGPHYWVGNISCPNSPGLAGLQDPVLTERLTRAMVEESQRQARVYDIPEAPVLMKTSPAPDLPDDSFLITLAAMIRGGAKGIIVSNTTQDRPDTLPKWTKDERGGLSGPMLLERNLKRIRFALRNAPAGFTIIASGGIQSGEDAEKCLDAGADLVQVYTGLIYRGTGLVPEICKQLCFWQES